MSTPQTTKGLPLTPSKRLYNTITESTSQWINLDHDTTDDDENKEYNNLQPYLNSLIQKRVLFVSIIQLYRSYKTIPSFILENALFTFDIKRSWLFPQTEFEMKESQNT
eukprot:540984_1